MLRSTFLKTLRDRRRGLVWWGAGIVLLVAWTVGFYPSIRGSAGEYSRILEQMPEALRELFLAQGADLSSPRGYLSIELFSFMVPILFLVYGIGFGARTVAGEEQEGSLDLLLSNPVSRRRVLAEKLAAMLVAQGILGGVLWVSLAAGSAIVDLDVPLTDLASAAVSGVLLGWAFGAIALGLGAATGRRALAVGITSALAVGSYLLNGVAAAVEALGPLRVASPFYWYFGGDPLSNGLSPTHAGLLIALVGAAVLPGLAAFDRRDLAT